MKNNNEQTRMEDLFRNIKFKGEDFPHEKEVWEKIERYIDKDRMYRRRRIGLIRYAAAAVLLMGIMTQTWFATNIKIATGGNQTAVVMPDGTNVTVHAHSRLRYNRLMWRLTQHVRLDGAAAFSGSHGEKFTVQTRMGDIAVLGTRFLVQQSEEVLRVECYEGSVEVTTRIGNEVLRQDEYLEYNSREMHKARIWPPYIEFDNALLSEVLSKIGEVYDTPIDVPANLGEIRFSGDATTTDIEEALTVVCRSCNVGFRAENGRIEIH